MLKSNGNTEIDDRINVTWISILSSPIFIVFDPYESNPEMNPKMTKTVANLTFDLSSSAN